MRDREEGAGSRCEEVLEVEGRDSDKIEQAAYFEERGDPLKRVGAKQPAVREPLILTAGAGAPAARDGAAGAAGVVGVPDSGLQGPEEVLEYWFSGGGLSWQQNFQNKWFTREGSPQRAAVDLEIARKFSGLLLAAESGLLLQGGAGSKWDASPRRYPRTTICVYTPARSCTPLAGL